MTFELTEEQLAVQEAARDFAQNVLKPGVIERDTKMEYPTEQIRQMGELGFLGMMVSPEYGGGGMDTMSYVLAMEEISKVDNSCSVIMSVNNSLVCWGIETFGTEQQKAKYLPKLASGEWIGSFCLSEPEAGSDATMQRTTAIEKDDHYLLNGTTEDEWTNRILFFAWQRDDFLCSSFGSKDQFRKQKNEFLAFRTRITHQLNLLPLKKYHKR